MIYQFVPSLLEHASSASQNPAPTPPGGTAQAPLKEEWVTTPLQIFQYAVSLGERLQRFKLVLTSISQVKILFVGVYPLPFKLSRTTRFFYPSPLYFNQQWCRRPHPWSCLSRQVETDLEPINSYEGSNTTFPGILYWAALAVQYPSAL